MGEHAGAQRGYNIWRDVYADPFVTLPTPVDGVAGARMVAVGLEHACAIVEGGKGEGGTVQCWGHNEGGQLGDGTRTLRKKPVAVKNLSGVTHVSCGSNHSCARKTDGSIWCWGDNRSGELGDGTHRDRPVPVAVTQITGATGVMSREGYNCAAFEDDTATCLGSDPPSKPVATAVAPRSLRGVVQVASGHAFGCALRNNGQVACWGDNDRLQLGDGSTEIRHMPALVVW